MVGCVRRSLPCRDKNRNCGTGSAAGYGTLAANSNPNYIYDTCCGAFRAHSSLRFLQREPVLRFEERNNMTIAGNA
jgi:hypothetical protein